MSASKLSEQIGNKYLPTDNRFFRAEIEKALDEMALRVFEDTRERAAKLLDSLARQWATRLPIDQVQALNCKQYAKAIRAMQPEV